MKVLLRYMDHPNRVGLSKFRNMKKLNFSGELLKLETEVHLYLSVNSCIPCHNRALILRPITM